MSSIKLTPLVLFLILLIVLVISVIFGYRANQEGFTMYKYTKASIDTVWIPQYTKTSSTPTVYKLYDNIFFDNKNGNLIEIDASANGSATNYDNSGATIKNIYITTRANSNQTARYLITLSNENIIAQDTTESLISALPNSFQSFKYITQSPNTDKYTAFYMPWNDSTYIHIIVDSQTGSDKNIGTFLFGPSNTVQNKFYADDASLNLSSYVQDNDASNNKAIVDLSYSSTRQIYQLSHNVKFDALNANLILKTGSTLIVYDRNGTASQPITNTNPVTNLSSEIQNVAFNSFTVLDSDGQVVVLYTCVGKKTVLSLISYKDNTKNEYALVNVKRFSESGLDIGQVQQSVQQPVQQPVQAPSSSPQFTEADFYRLYWNTKGMPGIPNANRFSEDYLLKTQIVPPVCPTCPSCPACAANPSSSVICSNCGGQGGSGTLDVSGSTTVKTQDTRTNLAGAVSNLGGDVGGVANKLIDTTGGLIKGAASGTKDIITGAASGTRDFIKDAAKGTKDVATDVVVGTKDIVKDVAGETGKLLTSAGRGVRRVLTEDGRYGQGYGYMDETNIRTRDNKRWQQGNYPYLGTNNQPAMDQYSYYGSLPAKPSSKYLPVTADFSAFGR